MTKARIVIYFWLLLILVIGYLPLARPELVLASPGKLVWSIVDTPSEVGKVIASNSEINALVIGADGKTFYTIDIPHKKVYKSTDKGVTWVEIGVRLPAGALPAWDIAIAPDDPKIVAVVTNNRTQVYLSTDGGTHWVSTNVPPTAVVGGLLIADIAISPPYILAGKKTYDIAIGTRLPGLPVGDVWVMQLGVRPWLAQGLGGDVTAIHFSPKYDKDTTILAIASNNIGTFLCHGRRDVGANTTNWNVPTGYPVRIPWIGLSPTEGQIITSGLALPSDYDGGEPAKRRVYVYYDSLTPADDVYRIDDAVVRRLEVTPPARLASIAYTGTYEKGKLIVGGRLAEANLAQAVIRYTKEPEKDRPVWETPLKPPTGGGESGYANAQVAWSPDGKEAYCGTATAYIINAAAWVNMNYSFPVGPWRGDWWDESAFSVTKDGGKTWNQLSLIDTKIWRLGDVAVSADSKTLYLASINNVPGTNGFDSVWRSTSDPLGKVWERVWCGVTAFNDLILRTNEKKESDLLILAERADALVGKVYSSLDKGQQWTGVVSGIVVTDVTLDSDEVFYILEGVFVRRVERIGVAWRAGDRFYTGLLTGHTIITPLRDPKDTDYVIVGDGGGGRVAYSRDGGRTFYQTKAVPVPGKIHVAADEKFEVNKIIYAASDGPNGKIYRWTIDQSLLWEELFPPKKRFYGLVQKDDVLYGVWWDDIAYSGVDRTLYPRAILPSPGEWDSLITELPALVIFNREPSSLKISRKDKHLSLWAIDNRQYKWVNKEGCLWNYIDTLAKVGPWATAPAPGELLPFDPVTGWAASITFRWYPLPDVIQYELWIAGDEGFSAMLRQEIVDPPDVLGPALILPAGALSTGRTYYWKVRASQAYTGEVVRSPWSATMFFTVKTGARIKAPYIGPFLLSPANRATGISRSPAFSWAPVPNATEYEFVLAKDVTMTQIIVKDKVFTTAYKYGGELDWGTTYFWQVRVTKPFLSPLSPINSFTVVEKAVEPDVTQVPPQPTPLWAWVLIGVLAILLVTMVVVNFFGVNLGLIFKKLVGR